MDREHFWFLQDMRFYARYIFNAPQDIEQQILDIGSNSRDDLDDHKIVLPNILHIVEKIFIRAPLNTDEDEDDVDVDGDVDVQYHHRIPISEKIDNEARKRQVEAIFHKIDAISCELGKNRLTIENVHQPTMSLLTMLSSYSWEAKLILILAAFALNYGEFILKQLPMLMEERLYGIFGIQIKAILKLARCIVAFKGLPNVTRFDFERMALSNAREIIAIGVYFAANCVVLWTSYINNIISTLDMPAWAQYSGYRMRWLPDWIQEIRQHLQKQLNICRLNIDKKRKIESYESLVRIINEVQTDNIKVLKALICLKDDALPIYDGSSKKRVHVDVLRSKTVLLLISSLDNYQDDILKILYNQSCQDSAFKVVWVPIVDRMEDPMLQKDFETLRATMPWYTPDDLKMVDHAVIRLVKEKWNFRNTPILVVLDPEGRVVNQNAIHMMWIWGSNAFPFTRSREEDLWKKETWRLELLVDGNIDPSVLGWIREGKYIFLYGGTDIEWIRKFTSAARSMALAACIPLEMIYVEKCAGQSRQVERVMETIASENLSHTWQDPTISFFWARLESMLFSKIQLDQNSKMTQEIEKLFSYDKNGGWAVLSHGNQVFVNGHGSTVLPTLSQYDTWKEHIPEKGFERSLKDHHDKLHKDSPPCCRFEFLSSDGRVPDNISCPQCDRKIYSYTTFLCCHDHP